MRAAGVHRVRTQRDHDPADGRGELCGGGERAEAAGLFWGEGSVCSGLRAGMSSILNVFLS